MRRLAPGLILDLYMARRRYDDQQHHIKRETGTRWEE